jgi:hypothetical protein
MVADWTVAFGRFFRISQIQPISLYRVQQKTFLAGHPPKTGRC